MTMKGISRRTALGTGLATGLTLAGGLPALGQTREVIEMAKGPADAEVTVIEYASFTCPHCATFHSDVYPQLRANFIDTGRVRFVMREVYFDKYGLWAGMLARCAGPVRYFGMVDLIFSRQSEWLAGRPDDTVVISDLYKLGRQAGMTNDEMEACLQDRDFAEALLAEYQKNAEADNVRGTPSFVINGEMHSNMGYAAFADLLNTKLES